MAFCDLSFHVNYNYRFLLEKPLSPAILLIDACVKTERWREPTANVSRSLEINFENLPIHRSKMKKTESGRDFTPITRSFNLILPFERIVITNASFKINFRQISIIFNFNSDETS